MDDYEKKYTEGAGKVSLRGIVYCKGCGKKLYYDKSGRSRFCCNTRYTDKPHDKCLVSIRSEDLEEVVISEIQKYIETCVDFKKFLTNSEFQ